MTTAQLEQWLTCAFSERAKGRAPALMRSFLKFFKMLKRIEPVKLGHLLWECPWIRTQGRRVDWYACTLQIDQDTASFFLKSRYSFTVDLKRKEFIGLRLFDFDGAQCIGYELAEWILAMLTAEMNKFLSAPERYNRSIARRLPFRYRLGKIRRKQVWEHQKGAVYRITCKVRKS